MTKLLFGVHDAEGAHLVPDGGWCLGLTELSKGHAPTNYDPRLNWLVRLNWGYGYDQTGTIPQKNNLLPYIGASLDLITNSKNCTRFIVGNEPNHENERPGGQYITPDHYAECYKRLRLAVRHNFGDSFKLLLAAPAPYHADPYPWTQWYRAVLEQLYPDIDGFTCHAYGRTQDAEGVHSEEKSYGALNGLYWGFKSYRDFMSLIPQSLAHLEVHLTEFNPIPGWSDSNTGIVKAAYTEVNWWNTTMSDNLPKISSLLLYRYPGYDEGAKWSFEKKEGVLQDFREAVSSGYRSPEPLNAGQQTTSTHKLVLPSVHSPEKGVEGQKPAIQVPSIDLDPRAVERGVRLDPHPSLNKWMVRKIQWFDKEQAKTIGGDHHIYLDTLDEAGQRLVGVPIRITWSTGTHQVYSEAKPGEPYAANYPMSPSRNDFSVEVIDNIPSDSVWGIGMGQDTPEGYNAGEHTSTVVIFQKVKLDKWDEEHLVEPVPEKEPEVNIPNLFHPLNNPAARITQGFGEVTTKDPKHYEQYGLKAHNGIDYSVVVGTAIYAVDGGTVAEVSEQEKGYGKWILLNHEWGQSLYAHLSKQSVQVGSRVARGQFLGATGNTGDSSGPHLHFGLTTKPRTRGWPYNGYVDPAPYIKTQVSPAEAPTKQRLQQIILAAANEYGVDYVLLGSLIMAESSWVATAYNPESSASGLGQFMPSTWADVAPKVGAVDVFNPTDNARATAYYLDWCIKQAGSTRKGLWAYNWGAGKVTSGKTPPPETIEYANKILFGVDLVKAMGG